MKPIFPIAFALLAVSPAMTFAQKRAVKKPTAKKSPTQKAASNSTPKWIPMPLLSPEAAKAGIAPGGEGAQWPRDIVISHSDPNFLLLAIDVGGLYRSSNGGKLWQQATVGWNARGANAFAIDPKNADHVIGIGGNSIDWSADWGGTPPHGLYHSNNRAASWKHVLSVHAGLGGSVAFDPASYDSARKICTVAYYASHTVGLYKTTDGGEAWSKVSAYPVNRNLDKDTDVFLRVHPMQGIVYLGGKDGFWRSENGGTTFKKMQDGEVWGMDTVAKQPDIVYITGSMGVQVSRDAGRTFAAVAANGLDRQGNKPVRTISVSPADPKRMSAWIQGDNWQWKRYSSHDGGINWQEWKIEKGFAPLPQNVRQGYAAWHPIDPNRVYAIGGDWVTRSDDGGRTFRWDSNGYNGIMLGGMFNFSKHTPNTVFLAFQDYNGAFTHDGGTIWNYRDVSGKGWGGYCYGGHAVDKQTMYYGDAESWGSKRNLKISHDGGATWKHATDANSKNIVLAGPDVAVSDPSDARILFASNHRSTDKGITWQPMLDCDGVYTVSLRSKMLLGKKGSTLVFSDDQGAAWKTMTQIEGGIDDIAANSSLSAVYVASQEKLKRWNGRTLEVIPTPRDQYGNSRVTTVAVDPHDDNVIYVGGPRNTYASHATVCRSTDGGGNWTNLTMNTPLDKGGTPSPHEVSAIRVHTVTRQAWVNGQCYGMWRINPPAANEKGKSALEASAPKAETPPIALPSEPQQN